MNAVDYFVTLGSSDTRAHALILWSRYGIALVLVLGVLLELAGIRVDITTQCVIYLICMVGINLPHGGFENLNNMRYRPPGEALRYFLTFTAGMVAFVLFLFKAPVFGLGLALTVAMIKCGYGALAVLDATSGTRHLHTPARRWLAIAVHGGMVMIVPILAWPAPLFAFGSTMVDIFKPGGLLWVGVYYDAIRLGLGGLYGIAVLVHLVLGYRDGRGLPDYRIEALEILLLIAFFVAVPALIAVGVYFALWYSLRQIARFLVVEQHQYGIIGPRRIFWMGVLGTLATFALMALFYLVAPAPLGGLSTPIPGLVAFYSLFISVVALPHIVVGEWLDRRHGIWNIP